MKVKLQLQFEKSELELIQEDELRLEYLVTNLRGRIRVGITNNLGRKTPPTVQIESEVVCTIADLVALDSTN